MKNFIPLILAVLLGFAAVLAVGRLLESRKQAVEDTTTVVAAARNVAVGDVLTADSVMKKEIPVSARPAQAIGWARSEMVIGQKALRPVGEGDYLLLSDVGFSRSMGDIVGEGEWAVTLNLPAGGISKVVQPGDEVAVIGTFTVKAKVESADNSEGAETEDREVTATLFPRVRVLDVGEGRGGEAGNASEIIVALPPQQAQVLISAQRTAELALALRRAGDEASVNRTDLGMVDDNTFKKLLEGLPSVQLPKTPGAVGVKLPEKPAVGQEVKP